MKFIYLPIILLIVLSINSNAQTTLQNGDYRTKVFNATWSNPAHWQKRTNGTWAIATTPPGANDNVYIQASHFVTITGNTACKDLHLNTTPTEPRLDVNAFTLTVNGKIRAYAGNATTSTADGNLPGTNSTPSAATNWITCTTGKILIAGGSRTVFNTGEWGSTNIGAPVVSGNGFDLEISPASDTDVIVSQTEIKARNITITTGTLDMGTSRIAVDQFNIGTGNIVINGTLKSASSGIQSGGIVMSRDINARIGTLTIGSTGVLSLSGADPRIDASTIVNNGKVIYNGAAQTLIRPSGSDASAITFPTYNNLTLAGTGSKTLVVNTTVNGILSRQNTASLSIGAFSFGYGPTGTLEYAGNAAQIPGSELPLLNGPFNLQINNSAGITLTSARTITGNLKMLNGILTTTVANLLTLADNATVSNVSDSSYVSGPVSKVGDDEFTFPVGKGGKYRPISISAPASITDVFTAEYFNSSHPQGGTVALGTSGLNRVSQVEYWDIARTSGTSVPDVTLSWNPHSGVSSGALSDLRVAHYNGSTWDNLGNTSTTGTIADGTISASTSSLTSFSPFTLATISLTQPLPLQLIEFAGRNDGKSVQLEWVTTCEDKLEKYAVEYSAGGDFSTIGFLSARNQGCGNNQSYQFTHRPVDNFPSIYRLKMLGFDGRSFYSNTLYLKSGNTSNVDARLLQNPVKSELQVTGLTTGTFYQITDITGHVLLSGFSIGGTESINIGPLSSGLYLLRSGSRIFRFAKQ